MSENLSLLSAKEGWSSALFESIRNTASLEPSVQQKKLQEIAARYLLGSANTRGTLSFYDHFNPDHKKKKIFICNGTACMVSGTQQNLKNRISNYIKESDIGEMCCLGRCHENAAFHYNGRNYSGNDAGKIEDILSDQGALLKDEYRVKSTRDKPVLTGIFDFKHYTELFDEVRTRDPLKVLEDIKQSNLKGRGGAAFYLGDKLETCRAQDSYPKFVVCNADEGDPGSYSDRYLLEEQPHAVIFGMLTSALIVGADYAIVYIRSEYPEATASMERAIGLWEDYFAIKSEKKTPPIALKIVVGAGSYICGEETALLSSLEGQRPEVRIRPPYPAQSGLFLKPTVVNNVETLATIPYIIEHGPASFSKIGTDATPGVKLMSLDGLFNNPGIIEVEMGTQLHLVINNLGGGFKLPVKALQIGGPLGGIIPLEEVKNLSVDFESFQSHGFDLGHASVVSIPKDFPMIKYLEHLFEFAAHESCGKCFPLPFGYRKGKRVNTTSL